MKEEFEEALRMLERIMADAEQKGYWEKSLQEGLKALQEIENLERNRKRISQMLEKAKEEQKSLDAAYPEKVRAFALAQRDRKVLSQHRTQIREVAGMIQDCEAAAAFIEKEILKFKSTLQHARTACERIRARL